MNKISQINLFFYALLVIQAVLFFDYRPELIISIPYFLIPAILILFIIINKRNEYGIRPRALTAAAPLLLYAFFFAQFFNQSNQGLWGIAVLYKKNTLIKCFFLLLMQILLLPEVNSKLSALLIKIRIRIKRTSFLEIGFFSIIIFMLFRDKAISRDGYDWISAVFFNQWGDYLREPYSLLIFQIFYKIISPAGIGAEIAISLASSFAGAFFLCTLIRISRILNHENYAGSLIFILGMVSVYGIMQLYFGHIEVYGIFVTCVFVYIFLALNYISGKQVSFILIGIYFAFLLGIHIAAAWLLPSFCILPFLKKDTGECKKKNPWGELALSSAAMLITGGLLLLPILFLFHGGSVKIMWNNMIDVVTATPDRRVFLPLSMIFSFEHLKDLINLYLKSYPSLLVLLIFGYFAGLFENITAKGNEGFLIVCLIPCLLFSLVYRLGRGAMEDWDSFSILGPTLGMFILSHISRMISETDLQNNKKNFIFADLISIILFFISMTFYSILNSHFIPRM